MKKSKKQYESRRKTPWENSKELTPLQKFISDNYKEHYMQRHPQLSETGEVELINSIEPVKFCEAD